MREVTIHKELRHAHIIRLYNAFQEGPTLYIILEYMDNGNIFKMIREKTITVDVAVRIFAQVIGCLAYFHSKNIIHRDIKPENILWNSSGHFKLSDFGFCGDFLEAGGRKTMCGTTEYIAPEVIMSERQTDKLDIWCMGILLYEMLHFRSPYQVKNTYWLMQEIKTKKVVCESHVPKEFVEIILACLNVDPLKRPSAQQLLDSHPILRKKINNNESQSNFGSMNSPLKAKTELNGQKANSERCNFKKQKSYEQGGNSGSQATPIRTNNDGNYSSSSNKGGNGPSKGSQLVRPVTSTTPTVGLYSNQLPRQTKETLYAHKYHLQLPKDSTGPSVYAKSTSLNNAQDTKQVSTYSNEGQPKPFRPQTEVLGVPKSKSGYHLNSDRSDRPTPQLPLNSKRSVHFIEGSRPNAYTYSNTVSSNLITIESRREAKTTPDVTSARSFLQAPLRPTVNASSPSKEYPEARLYTESNQGLLIKRIGDLSPTSPQFVNIYHRSQHQNEILRTQPDNKPTQHSSSRMIRAGSLTSPNQPSSNPSKDYSVRVINAPLPDNPPYVPRTMENFRYSLSHVDAKLVSPKQKQQNGDENEERLKRFYSAEKLRFLGPSGTSGNQMSDLTRTTVEKNPRLGSQASMTNRGPSPKRNKTLGADEMVTVTGTEQPNGVNIRSISRGHSSNHDSVNSDTRRFLLNPFAPRKAQ